MSSSTKPVKAGLVSKFNAVADSSYLASAIVSMFPFIGFLGAPGVAFLPLISGALGTVNGLTDAWRFAFANKPKAGDSGAVLDLKGQFRKASGFATLMRAGSVAGYTASTFFLAAAIATSISGFIAGGMVLASLLSGSVAAGMGLLARRNENKMALANAALKTPEPPKLV